jgi:hypothetical protein
MPLSVKEASDGTVLLNCFHVDASGKRCSCDAIVSAIGLQMRDLFPPSRNGQANSNATGSKKSGFATLQAAIDWQAKKLSSKTDRGWDYSPTFHVRRFNLANDKKQFKPFHRDLDGWRIKDPDGKLSLYHVNELATANVVYVLEGEKCADLARGLGLTATTSAHGCQSPGKSDWTPLADKTVYLVPDNDEPGEGYVNAVGAILAELEPKPMVKVLRLPLRNESDDIEQWLEVMLDSGERGPDECRMELERLTTNAVEWVAKPGIKSVRQGGATDDRPAIEITHERHQVAQETIKVLVRDQEIYSRGGSLGIVIEEEHDVLKLDGGVQLGNAKGAARFLVLSTSRLGCYLTKNARFGRWVKNEQGDFDFKKCGPPAWLIKAIETWGHWPGARPLRTLCTSPFVRVDGSLSAVGYDQATGALYRPSVAIAAIPERPTQEEANEAAALLYKPVHQFPFATGHDWAVWLALVLTGIQRPLIGGPVPGFAFVGNKAGCGKGLLIDAAGILVWGHPIPTRTYPEDSEEAKKVKLSLGLSGVPVVHFDNLPEGGFYGSGAFDSALTSTVVEDRILGLSRDSGPVPLRPVWTLSGNNISPAKDAYRRWLPCGLMTPLEIPHERADLAVADLRQHLVKHRGELLRHALVILKAHAIPGRPVGWKAPLGSFEEWDKIVRGAVWFATGNDCLETQRKATRESPERLEKFALLTGWAKLPNGITDGHTVHEAISTVMSMPDLYPGLHELFRTSLWNGKRVDANRLAYRLRSLKGTPIEKMTLERAGENDAGTSLWRVKIHP